jgi:SAM-dependent methyltransferase
VVGRKGRVLAEDIMPDVRDALSDRIQRERLDNVAVKLGTTDNPMLPAASFDRVFLVHMYHEVQSPYAFLWHLREGVKPDGLVVVVDSNRPVKQHGIPPAQLKCEFAALGMEPVKLKTLTGGEVYLMAFRLARPRPAPERIEPCKG